MSILQNLEQNVLIFALRLKVLLPVRPSGIKATEDAMLTLRRLQWAIMLTTTTAGLKKMDLKAANIISVAVMLL